MQWLRRCDSVIRRLVLAGLLGAGGAHAAAPGAGPASWNGDLAPITAAQWNAQRAAHLLERAGFGATPEEVARFAAMTPQQAVATLVRPQGIANDHLPPFDASGIFEPGLDPFPASRPATTEEAKAHGAALGVAVKPEGNRRLQPVVNKFFYWLRASRLETHRVAYWWADRMLRTNRPLEEKMALFWHGHFATHEDKVRDARKMLQQLQLFEAKGLGNFRELMIGVAQDPAMLAFLDAGVNVKGAPNENFAREIMEMFTMGVGQYSERDIREAARAFTGWNFQDLRFVVDTAKHDDGEKAVLGRSGRFDGVQVIDVILAQPVTAEYLAGRIYRFLARDEITPELRKRLGAVLRDNRYEIAPLLETIFLSRDFYGPEVVGTRIKSPVELVVSTYRKLGLTAVPGVPDFNDVTSALGQHLLYPPTVAGWAYGRSWITPGLLMERGNFVRDVLFPDFTALPTDRFPTTATGQEIQAVHERISRGLDVTAATVPEGKSRDMAGGDAMAMSNRMVDRDEEFNTRYGSYRGWQKAVEVVKPIPRTMARVDLAGLVRTGNCRTAADAVDLLAARFLSVPPSADQRAAWIGFLQREWGTEQVERASTYMEDGLRVLLHLMLASPDYQLG